MAEGHTWVILAKPPRLPQGYATACRAGDHRILERGISVKKVTCPPCGAEFKVEDADELVEIVQRHAKTKHNTDLSREEILNAAKDV